MAMAVHALLDPRVQAHHPRAARGRGRREARLPAGRPGREGEPVPAPALRRAPRHDGHRAGRGARRARADRGRAARVHARPHAQRLLRHPRRGAERDQRADAHVPDAPRLRARRRWSPATSRRSTCRTARRAASPRRASCSPGIEGIAFCTFTEVDVVRHPLVQKIIVAYERARPPSAPAQRETGGARAARRRPDAMRAGIERERRARSEPHRSRAWPSLADAIRGQPRLTHRDAPASAPRAWCGARRASVLVAPAAVWDRGREVLAPVRDARSPTATRCSCLLGRPQRARSRRRR